MPSLLRVPPAVRRVTASVLLLLLVAGCAATTEVGPPVETPTDIVGINQAFHSHDVAINDLVSGDAGCTDPDLIPTAIAFSASGLDQSAPVRIRLYIFRNADSYQKLRPKVDTCSQAWVTDASTYEAIDVSPFVATGQGPWGSAFRDAIRAALTTAAGNGGVGGGGGQDPFGP